LQLSEEEFSEMNDQIEKEKAEEPIDDEGADENPF